MSTDLGRIGTVSARSGFALAGFPFQTRNVSDAPMLPDGLREVTLPGTQDHRDGFPATGIHWQYHPQCPLSVWIRSDDMNSPKGRTF
jgi:hypothetical protein